MKLFILFAGCIILASCGNSPLVNKLEGADSVAIRFYKPGTTTVNNVAGTSKAGAIKALLVYVDGKQTEGYTCGYDGGILFYKQSNVIADIAFNYTRDGCHNFMHTADGKNITTSMNNEAVDFLKGVSAGEK